MMEKEFNIDISPDKRGCLLTEFPLVDYKEIYSLQQKLVAAVNENQIEESMLLLLEHHPVYTLGKRGGRENLIVSESFLEEKGIDIIQIERGGNITYHGPGQLVAYPVVNLKKLSISVDAYVAGMEEVMIRTSEKLGVLPERNPKNHGIWVGNNKIGSVGIAIRHGVTFHGLALNVSLSLDPFTWINPCGLTDVGMTSIEKETGDKIKMDKARAIMKECFSEIFGFTFMETDVRSLLTDNRKLEKN